MSTVLHRRDSSVAITAAEAAKELVETSADIQAEFFESMAEEIENWPTRLKRQIPSWHMQCRFIADEMDDGQRSAVAQMLETLVEHLREVREPRDPNIEPVDEYEGGWEPEPVKIKRVHEGEENTLCKTPAELAVYGSDEIMKQLGASYEVAQSIQIWLLQKFGLKLMP